MLSQNLNYIQNRAGLSGVPTDLGTIIGNVLPWAFGITGFLLLIYMVSGGFQIMTSKGDPKGMAAGQAKITSSVIGFVIVLLSAGLVVLIGRLLNINVFTNLF